jgi:hypothetical protein
MVVNMSNTPAFPSGNDVTLGDWRSHGHSGMTLRDYFAAKSLANEYTQHDGNPDKVAEWAYAVADAMLKAREA